MSDLSAAVQIGAAMLLSSTPGASAPDGIGGVRDAKPAFPARQGDLVTFHFVVVDPSGKEIANTERRGLPYSIVLGDRPASAVWAEALLGLKPGEERVVMLDSSRFGPAGVPPIVAPSVTLTARVKVLSISAVAGSGPGSK